MTIKFPFNRSWGRLVSREPEVFSLKRMSSTSFPWRRLRLSIQTGVLTIYLTSTQLLLPISIYLNPYSPIPNGCFCDACS
ncbi:hypothetical protein EV363DRAFT_1156752 [Boletus edulis]|uniref:Uncharacterized protein n=1 Tax=Boletus edulis BED1 TaxID=1328754 RepID=A0AAD4BTA4_BOLED|nr:hypothetical protein EV363DRAFT_1156752 [Boletus edulis]KAF8438841.1 hypothetical protein L210DRAFT_205673 [Boletus edulis BED1]